MSQSHIDTSHVNLSATEKRVIELFGLIHTLIPLVKKANIEILSKKNEVSVLIEFVDKKLGEIDHMHETQKFTRQGNIETEFLELIAHIEKVKISVQTLYTPPSQDTLNKLSEARTLTVEESKPINNKVKAKDAETEALMLKEAMTKEARDAATLNNIIAIHESLGTFQTSAKNYYKLSNWCIKRCDGLIESLKDEIAKVKKTKITTEVSPSFEEIESKYIGQQTPNVSVSNFSAIVSSSGQSVQNQGQPKNKMTSSSSQGQGGKIS